MREPIYRSRPVEPHPARFDWCRRVHDRVVMSEGNSNVYLIETDGESVLVNSGMGFEAPVHKHNLDQFSTAPIRYLVATQGHVDHLGGTAFFKHHNPDLELVTTSANAEHQAYDARLERFRRKRSAFAFADQFIEVFGEYAEHGYTEVNPQDSPTPDVTFDNLLELTMGDTDVVLIAQPGAETNDSLVVWLPEERICLTGNLFGCPFGHFPNLVTMRGDRYRDAVTVAAAVQTVRDLQPEIIMYGHHDPIVGTDVIDAELAALHGAILHVHDAVVDGMNAGIDVHTLMAEIDLPPELEVGQGYGKVSWSVRAIWEHYAGWFHARSTTELYAVPRSSVDADLVELAGADALIARANHLAAGGRREEALHLLDVVLGAEPDRASARAAAIDVHQSLLADSQNFWLSAWLHRQITLLRGEGVSSLRVG